MRSAFFISINFIFILPVHAEIKTVLSILTPFQTLDNDLINQFEKEHNICIRTEFTSTNYEYESRLRSDIRTYDIVIGMEQELSNLATLKLLNPTTLNQMQTNTKNTPLGKKSKFSDIQNAYVTLAADPLGIAYFAKTVVQKGPMSWDWLIKPNINPQWRQRVFVPKDPRIIILLAILANQEKISENTQSLAPGSLGWIKSLLKQNAHSEMPLYTLFSIHKIHAAVVFFSQYNALKNIIPDLVFGIPKKGTYYNRLAAGISLNANEPALAKKFIAFLSAHSESISTKTGLIDIATREQSFLKSSLKNWQVYDENLLLPKKILSDIQKLMPD
ncbi:MAG: extracellular solute-binding protein [Silvanigrellaceae bacterium]|nr:extracellular solute-binding protein [Silvanigrellaceae bacterium]